MGNARVVKFVMICYSCRAASWFKPDYNMDVWLFGLVLHRVKARVPYSWTIDSVCMDCDPEYC
jgi:hypothetical protein